MRIIRTDCEHCVFCKLSDNGTQTGCELGRSDLLGVETMSEEGSFILARFCNTYRPDEWVQELNLDESLDLQKTVIEEVCPKVGFFIYLDTNQNDYTMEKLTSTIESIAKIEHGPPTHIVIINDKVEFNEEIWGLFLKYFDINKTKYHIVQLNSKLDDVTQSLDAAFTHAQNGWIYVATSGETIASDVITRLNGLLNIEMKKLNRVESYDGFNGLMFPAFLFKFLNGNKNKMFTDKKMDTGSFVEKMQKAEARSNSKTIITWKEFNAS